MDSPGTPKEGASLKLKTARTLKWNTIDRLSTQLIYAAIGIVLANILPKEDFGLVGVILVFQAFAILFVDSGFGSALLQLKDPTQRDYSTVFWFNLVVSLGVYAILWICAPLIAGIFHEERLVSLSRVMFLTFILTALGIVQTNRLMKRMDVRQIALANIVGLLLSGAVGIWMAVAGSGVWALVAQSVMLSGIKSLWLWITARWRPTGWIQRESLHRIWRVGLGVFSTQFLNTLCLNIYPFIIGARFDMVSLGVYTQADKWSKMGSASLSQILTATFVPLLSRWQDDMPRFREAMGKVNRLTAFIVFPIMGALILVATPLFHVFFGTKWDEAIPLFQLLTARGIFIVYIQLAANYLLSLGHARSMVRVEAVKDTLLIGAIFATVWIGTVEALVWGMFVSSAVTCVYAAWVALRHAGYRLVRLMSDSAPYLLLTVAICFCLWWLKAMIENAALLLTAQLILGAAIYWAVLRMAGSHVLVEAQNYVFGRFHRKNSGTDER